MIEMPLAGRVHWLVRVITNSITDQEVNGHDQERLFVNARSKDHVVHSNGNDDVDRSLAVFCGKHIQSSLNTAR